MSKAFIAKPDSLAIHALVRMHADLGGQVIKNREEARKLAEAIKHVEAVIHLFDPRYDTRRIAAKRRKRPSEVRKGTIFRTALGILRAAKGPLTTDEICGLVFAQRGIAEPTRDQSRTMYGTVYRSLRRHEGRLVVTVGDEKPARWVLSLKS